MHVKTKFCEITEGSTMTNSKDGPYPDLCRNNTKNIETIHETKESPVKNLIPINKEQWDIVQSYTATNDNSTLISENESLKLYPDFHLL